MPMLIAATFPADVSKLNRVNPVEHAAASFLETRRLVHEMHRLSKSLFALTDGQRVFMKRPHPDLVIVRCGLTVPRGESVEVLALHQDNNPFAAAAEEEALDRIEAIAEADPGGPELLMHLHRQAALTFKLTHKMTPLEKEVLAYLAGF